MEENDELRRKLLKSAGINTIGSTRKKTSKLSENYYPVDGDIEYESYNDEEDYDGEDEN